MAKSAKSRIIAYIPIVVLLGGVVGAAYYQEQLTAFVNLRMWDKGAPSRTVADLLTAMKAGDQAKVAGLLGDPAYKPLEEGGKYVGLTLTSMAGTLDFRATELVGEPVAPGDAEFSTIGKGSAKVMAKDASGKEIAYRLEVVDGTWKVMEILGGVPRGGASPMAPKPKPKAPAVPGGKPAAKGK